MGERRGTKALELWCRRMTDGYPGVKIENMTTSWRDGLAFCAIIHRFRPDLIDFSKLKKNDVYHNNELAFRIAERHLGIPALLEPEDMVEFPVPDRLSILTYLSQFFQVFAGTQGSSQNRIAPKRAQTSPDHSIVSPASTSPPSKVALFGTGKIHREPCAKCALPVFIAERLNVGKSLYHRTCFKCARCTAQLTLDNYYETENGEYCCETCPDEEKPPTLNSPTVLSSPQNLNEESVRFRSMSDEEKTASIRAKFEIDEYSAEFETALEYSNDKSSTLNSEQSKEFTMARTHFMQTQINNSNSSSSSIGGEDSGNEDEKLNKKFGDCENELNNEQNDSGFPNINNNKLDTSVNIQISDSCSVSENLDKTENNIDVTKDKSVMENDINNSSLVKERKNLFENKQKSLDDEYPKAEQMSIINSKNENINLDKSDSLASQHDTSIIVISDSTIEEIEKESDDVIVITDSSTSNDNIKCELSDKPIDNNISVDKIETSEIINEIASNTEAVDYPEELNPFDDDNDDDDDDNGAEVIKKSPKDSMNPFDEDEDEEMNDVVNINLKPTPSPRLKKKLLPSSGNRLSTPLYVPRVSMSSEPPTPATRKKKALTAPKVSLNPFWSSGDEEENDKSMDKLPVPTPRLSRTSTTTTDTQSNVSSTVYGSNSSLSSSSTAPTGTLRKKKLAPKPPSIPLVKLRASESPESSKGSSPCPSIQQSPYLTPKHRKNRKAPPPPNVSTPFPNRQETFNELSINVSPIGTTETITKTTNEMHQQPDNNKIIEDEKIAKDETNRNRQSQEFNKNPMMENRRNSILNKSTHGKWKRRKGQAPSRPIPQKRTIKSLPMEEIRRELDIIEIQLQGLEKQGVQIEKLIREKCENQTDAENVVSTEDSLPSDAEELILQLFEVVNEKNELFRKQTELMYLKRQQRLEEEHADVEYQIRCLMLQPEANKTDFDKGREEALINRLVEIVEMRNEIIECLEMDRVREAEEDDCISNHLNMYTLKKSTPIPEIEKSHKEKKKHKKEKRFKFKSNPKTDADKDIDESETSINNSCSSSTKTEKKKKKHLKFF